jgi:hypothetical protein
MGRGTILRTILLITRHRVNHIGIITPVQLIIMTLQINIRTTTVTVVTITLSKNRGSHKPLILLKAGDEKKVHHIHPKYLDDRALVYDGMTDCGDTIYDLCYLLLKGPEKVVHVLDGCIYIPICLPVYDFISDSWFVTY